MREEALIDPTIKEENTMFKKTLFLFTLICPGFVLAAEPAPEIDPLNSAKAPQMKTYFYVFDKNHAHGAKGDIEGRIEYINSGQRLFNQSMSIHADSPEIAWLALPDPVALSVAFDKSTDTRIDVWVNDLLVDQYNVAGFDRLQQDIYTRHGLGQDKIVCNQDYCEPMDPCRFGLPNDCDRDGVPDNQDNCMELPNPNQANCDGDAWGDVCDNFNASYANLGSEYTCMADKDNHIGYVKWEHHVEQIQHDVSSCGAPNRYTSRVRSSGYCDPFSDDQYCCDEGIGTSIQQVGDNPSVWCGSKRNQDFCL